MSSDTTLAVAVPPGRVGRESRPRPRRCSGHLRPQRSRPAVFSARAEVLRTRSPPGCSPGERVLVPPRTADGADDGFGGPAPAVRRLGGADRGRPATTRLGAGPRRGSRQFCGGPYGRTAPCRFCPRAVAPPTLADACRRPGTAALVRVEPVLRRRRRAIAAHREAMPVRRADTAMADAVERQTREIRELSRRAFPASLSECRRKMPSPRQARLRGERTRSPEPSFCSVP